MDLELFLLERIAEEEEAWRRFEEVDPAFAESVEAALDRCRRKRRVVLSRRRDGGTIPLRQMQNLALPYYDHPDYDDDWRPPQVPRWSK